MKRVLNFTIYRQSVCVVISSPNFIRITLIRYYESLSDVLLRGLSPPQRPVCVLGRARALSIFSIIAIFIGIPSGSLCRGERFRGENDSKQ